MFLKEKGVCRVLNMSINKCCVRIPNASRSLQRQLNKMKQAARNSEAIAAELETNWLGKVFDTFGSSPPGWLPGLLLSLIIIAIVIIVICIVISCIKRAVARPVLRVEHAPLEPVCVLVAPMQERLRNDDPQ